MKFMQAKVPSFRPLEDVPFYRGFNRDTVLQCVEKALQDGVYTKLIVGASLTALDRVEALIRAYAHSGIQCVDVSATPAVVGVAARVLAEEGVLDRVALMVSFPLDADPHFRKIQLAQADCIDCGVCIPVCPTTVFSMPGESLAVNAPQCYGCNRCVPVCPTQALSLEPYSVMSGLAEALENPVVSAVEIHSTYSDPVMVPEVLDSLQHGLRGKLVSVCFRPQVLSSEQAEQFVSAFQQGLSSLTALPLMLQIDGEPMSATDDPEASVSALEAAADWDSQTSFASSTFLTISGGINAHTASLLSESRYHVIQGVGLGTAARTHVWAELTGATANPQLARQKADAFMAPFLRRRKNPK
jgi:ferredoxin